MGKFATIILINLLVVVLTQINAEQFADKTTVVASLYIMPGQKIDVQKELQAAKDLLSTVQNPIIFFTNSKVSQKIKSSRPSGWPVTFIEGRFQDLTGIRKYSPEFWFREELFHYQREGSFANDIMVYQKKEFMKKAVEQNPFKSDYFVYIDVNGFKSESLIHPVEKSESVVVQPGKLFVGNMGGLVLKNHGLVQWPSKYVSSSVIIGDKQAFLNYQTRYDEIMLKHKEANMSMGEDMDILGSLTYEHPDLVVAVTLSEQNNSEFGMLNVLAGQYLKLAKGNKQ